MNYRCTVVCLTLVDVPEGATVECRNGSTIRNILWKCNVFKLVYLPQVALYIVTFATYDFISFESSYFILSIILLKETAQRANYTINDANVL